MLKKNGIGSSRLSTVLTQKYYVSVKNGSNNFIDHNILIVSVNLAYIYFIPH